MEQIGITPGFYLSDVQRREGGICSNALTIWWNLPKSSGPFKIFPWIFGRFAERGSHRKWGNPIRNTLLATNYSK
jgi:hypothetical protein